VGDRGPLVQGVLPVPEEQVRSEVGQVRGGRFRVYHHVTYFAAELARGDGGVDEQGLGESDVYEQAADARDGAEDRKRLR